MTNLPEPVSRQDKLLHNIADETPSIEDLVPNCREEVYLKYIAINGAAKKEIPLKIEHGGTEAINSEQARENLGVYSKSEVNTMVSELSENYYNKTQTDNLLNLKANKSDLSQVATSGSYNDLLNTPMIPRKTSDLTNDSNFVSSSDLSESYYNKIQTDNLLNSKVNTNDLSQVATSGSYNDLLNTPMIPRKTSDLTNDSNFISSSELSESYYNKIQTDNLLNSKANTNDLSQVAISGQYSDLSGLPNIPSKTSDLINDSNFVSNSDLSESCYNKTQIDNFLTNKANSSHEHSANDITSGTLPVNRGGTGATTESNARSNLSVYSKSETDTLLSSKAPYEVKSSTDFNSMTTPGLYTMRSSSTNSPSGGSYHSLIVLKSDTGNYVQQLAVKESTTQMYLRYLSGSNWSDWSQVGSSSSSEFGTWSPTIGIEGPSGLTVSYDGGYRYGIYYTVNRLVYVSCHIKFQITSLTTSYYASIYNLPFIPRGDGIDRVSLHCTECLNALENNVIPRGHLVINQDSHIHLQNEGGYMAVRWKTAGGDYQYLGFSGCYLKS